MFSLKQNSLRKFKMKIFKEIKIFFWENYNLFYLKKLYKKILKKLINRNQIFDR